MHEALDPSEEMTLLVADIFEAAGVLRRNGERIARRVGQTQARWQVLSAASGQDLTVPTIARRLGVTRQAVQPVVDELARDRLVRLLANPAHRRSPLIVLTAKGQRALRDLTEAAAPANRQLAANIGRRQLAVARGALSEVIALSREPVTE